MKPQMFTILIKLSVGALAFILLSEIYQLAAVMLASARAPAPALAPAPAPALAPVRGLREIVPGLTGQVVVVDPGHGGADPGAMVGKTKEADLNMQLSIALKVLLESAGAHVALTRWGDQGIVPQNLMTYADQGFVLQQRKEFAAHQGGQMLISVHVNSNRDSRVSGGIVYYTDSSSLPLAAAIQQQINQFSGKSWQPLEKDFTITKGNIMPSVLVETAFLTNSRDREILTKKPEVLAQAIFAGIKDYAEKNGNRP